MKNLLFAVGPVEMFDDIREIGAAHLPYFRTEEFSEINNRIATNMKKCMFTEDDSKVALLTTSGTGAMEAAVINVFDKNDRILIIKGGDFGKRFVQICECHGLNYTVLELEQGHTLTYNQLTPYRDMGITGILVNIHETSTGVLYDGSMLGKFSREIGALLVVDAISSFLADEYKMDEWGIDISIISSQKALALPPGMSVIVANQRAEKRISVNSGKCIYLNLKDYFVNMERGQTPFTTAVGITLQMDQRLQNIVRTGVQNELDRVKALAVDFREKISEFNFTIPSERLSNAVTPLQPLKTKKAYEINSVLVFIF
jgi:aspartate aminotransferase-like enzyme